jgi:hypothetical protein
MDGLNIFEMGLPNYLSTVRSMALISTLAIKPGLMQLTLPCSAPKMEES